MKLRTSFFNPTVLRKDITRFAPVWGLYTVFMLMAIFLLWANDTGPARFAVNAPYIIACMGVVNIAYAGICALVLFGDLFQSKMAGTLHAMPLRREGWFLTHLSAGLLFCIVPNALGTVVASMILQEYCYLAFLWLGITVCQYLFFFGAAVFSIQCAGNRLGAAAVYGLLNLLAVLWAFLADTFYTPVLYGIQTDWTAICRHSPVIGFSMSQYVAVEYDNMYGLARFEGYLPEDWRYLFIAAAVGVALLGASVLLYRSRQLESAGDFMAVKPAAPIFLVLYTLCVGAVLYFLADELASGAEYVFLIIGFAIGFFTGFMLLEKRVNVFQLKKWIGLGAMTLAFFLTVAITAMDPAGITRYIPEASQISSVQLSPYNSDYYIDNRSLVLSEAEEIRDVLEVHAQVLEDRYPEHSELCLRLRYNLRSGATVDRIYYVDPDSPAAKTLQTYFSDFAYVTTCETPEQLLRMIQYVEYYSHNDDLPSMLIGVNGYVDNDGSLSEKFEVQPTTPAVAENTDPIAATVVVTPDFTVYEERDGWLYCTGEESKEILRGLFEAIYKDCQAGNMAQNWAFHRYEESVGNLVLCVSIGSYMTEYLDINIYPCCEHTANYLKSLNP